MDTSALWNELEAAKKELRLLKIENEDLKTKVKDMENLIGNHGVHQHEVLHIKCFLYFHLLRHFLIFE